MMSELMREHVRLSLLRGLHESPRYITNSSMLTDRVQAFGLDVSRDSVHIELHWLAEQGLVRVDPMSDLLVAELTARGADAVAGRTNVPGVKRPSPR